ncbi:MAG: asparagine synthase (glutamine-hydrolyzing) [Pseudolabrys sp.]
MCGVAGLVDYGLIDGARAESVLRAAQSRIGLRGPDGAGRWRDSACVLAHARLAIIELSALGAQPMERGDLVITYNGEIFNYEALRDELTALGHAFRSRSDTEVLLAGWEQWREGLLQRLVGMFAFAIWDRRRRVLVAARDRFGEKPFIYAQAGRRLAFGSDLVACEAMLGEQRPIDPQALDALFTLRFIPDPLTIVQGVHKLPPGCWLRFDETGLTVSRWSDLARERPPAVGDGPEARAELRRRFDAAVNARLVSDVPVGVFLSGGLDSSLVAASVAASGANLKTFTVGFDNAASYYEERPLAAAVARHLGADHTEIGVSAARVRDVLDGVFSGLDEPFADASAVPTYLVSEATRKKVTVVLTGDGADEVFGGYRRYWSELYSGAWQRIPAPLRSMMGRILSGLPEGKQNRMLEAVRRARRFVDTANASPAGRQAGWMRLMPEAEVAALLAPMHPAACPLEATVAALRETMPNADPVNRMLACDVAFELPGDMLVKVDRMSMAHALETRTPFLDQRVVEWAFALPGASKLGSAGGKPVGKKVLREAFRDRLPAEVFARPKRGFEMPVGDILAGPAAERLHHATRPQALAAQGLFAPAIVESWKRDLAGRRRDTSWHLWTMLAFQEWARLNGRAEALA